MNNSFVSVLNKINLPIKETDDGPSVLWIMAACAENRDSLTFRDHSHTFFELHLVLRGSVTYGLRDGERRVCEGEFFLISPKKMHKVISCEGDFTKITIAFEISESSELGKRLSKCADTVFKMNESIRNNIEFIAASGEEKGEYAKDIIRSRLTETVYFAAGAMSAFSEKNTPVKRFDPRVYRAKKYIDDNPQIFFSCEEVSLFCRVSVKQLGRLFKKYEDVSLLQYIHRHKIDCAKRMMLAGDLSLDMISESLGFSNVQYFNKFFFKHTGFTPGEFRKQSVSKL